MAVKRYKLNKVRVHGKDQTVVVDGDEEGGARGGSIAEGTEAWLDFVPCDEEAGVGVTPWSVSLVLVIMNEK